MIDFSAVRIGFITNLLWSRYGTFWQRLVAGAGAEVAVASSDEVALACQQPAVAQVPTLAFRRAAAQSVALGACDVIVVPDLNFGSEVERGGGQDRWVSDLPRALADALPSLPNVLAVPAELGEDVESVAVPLLTRLLGDPGKVTRVWARHRVAASQVEPRPAPAWSQPGKRTVGVLGQAWNLGEDVLASLANDSDHLVPMTAFDPSSLREEAWRADARLIPSDAETLGAARLLARRGSVARVTFVADGESGADAWLLQRARDRLGHKPLDLRYLQDLLPVAAGSATDTDPPGAAPAHEGRS